MNKAIHVSAYRRLTNRFCYGKRFLNVGEGGGGGDVMQESNLSIFQVGTLPENLVSTEEFYN